MRASRFASRQSLQQGATAAEVARLVFGEGLRTTLIGTVAGFALALAASRAIAALLFHVTAFDLPTYAAAMLVLLAIAAAGPSLRAE